MFSNFFWLNHKSIKHFKRSDTYCDSTIIWSVFDKIDPIILQYKFHPSTISIKQNLCHILKFVTLHL